MVWGQELDSMTVGFIYWRKWNRLELILFACSLRRLSMDEAFNYSVHRMSWI